MSKRGWNLRGPNSDRLDASGPDHYAWKGDDASPEAGRARARILYDLGACSECGKPARDRHHVDGNPLNNAPENVRSLCRRCHMQADGRLADVTERMRQLSQPQPPKLCSTCGMLYNPLRNGRCVACAAYYTRTGQERPERLWTKAVRSDAKRRRLPS